MPDGALHAGVHVHLEIDPGAVLHGLLGQEPVQDEARGERRGRERVKDLGVAFDPLAGLIGQGDAARGQLARIAGVDRGQGPDPGPLRFDDRVDHAVCAPVAEGLRSQGGDYRPGVCHRPILPG